MRLFLSQIGQYICILLQALLLVATAIYLLYFAAHAWSMLVYPYPLDYGEGPLLDQIEILRAGTPVWQIYANPAQAPFQVVNYPPLYPLLVVALSLLTGDSLSAGRLLSLLAALGCGIALFILTQGKRQPTHDLRQTLRSALIALLFLTIPIVREWSVLLRVDMLGVCLGLWGLVALRMTGDPTQTTTLDSPTSSRSPQLGWAIAAGLLFLLALYTKPSLIAAPAAGYAWLLFEVLRQRKHAAGRQTLIAGLASLVVMLASGGLLFGLLQWASGGWFALHVIVANANRWDGELARQFWLDQTQLRWPLALAATGIAIRIALDQRPQRVVMPLLYTAFGVVTAIGVGKVGAYSNYFLELYAGLIWLIGLSANTSPRSERIDSSIAASLQPIAIYVLLLASLFYYLPLWDANRLRPAGQIEPAPPRLAFGRYGLWRDAQREADVLAAKARVQAVLTMEARAAGAVIFTDIPGVAAAADVQSRIQIFEQRQLFDQGQWEQGPLLIELANGAIPLAVIDYLGNWLTPEMITVLQRRYAQDGSLGTFDLYRPVAPGPRISADLAFPGGLNLNGYHLAPSVGALPGSTYAAGELLGVTLEWQRAERNDERLALDEQSPLSVVIQLTDGAGYTLIENERPLLYGALASEDLPPGAAVQHMYPITLPAELPPRSYSLALTLRAAGNNLAPPREFAQVTVESATGHLFTETGYFVPEPFLGSWEALGGIERAGYPLMSAVPFSWGVLQCFERICLEQRDGVVGQRALGEQLYLAETLRSTDCHEQQAEGATLSDSNGQAPCAIFHELWQQYGAASLGSPISGEVMRNGFRVQWTRYARLEYAPDRGETDLGRLGDDALRLPPGVRYRWP
ncbi:MAG: hypothetical protein MI924_18580 [Chloroflexales bacterium]|nr:hypothetical protein [Chloroflexales bacterium]